jgi:hypothetical protein
MSHLASDVDGHGIGELEGVEEGVGDDGGSGIGAPHLVKLGNHFRTEDTSVLVGQLDRTVPIVGCLARLDPHVELA